MRTKISRLQCLQSTQSSTIIFLSLLKLKISWLSQSSIISECRDQIVHKIACYLSQSVDLKNKQQFLTTKALIKRTGFYKACCATQPLNNALLQSIKTTLRCVSQEETQGFSRRNTGLVKEEQKSGIWLLIGVQKVSVNSCLKLVSKYQNIFKKHVDMFPTIQNPSIPLWSFSGCKLAFFHLL